MADHSLLVCIAAIKEHVGQFYVYILLRPDGRPFYVGCGRAGRVKHGERLTDHEAEARRGLKSLKHSIIRKILDQGGEIIYVIDSWHIDRDSMVKREIELIATIGRRQTGAGPLANRTDGGGGGAGAIMSAAARRKMSQWRKGRKPTEKTREKLRIARAASREVLSEKQRLNWADPDYRARVTKNMSGKELPAATKEKLRIATSRTWQDAQIAAKRKAAQRIAMTTPEYREQAKQNALRLWSDPLFRARVAETKRLSRETKRNNP